MAPSQARTARGTLTRERITDAALAIIEAQGVDRMTMRSLAAELDCGTMSLYTHVKNRDDLHAAIVERLIVELDVPTVIGSAADDWEALLELLLQAYFELALAHPRAFELLALAPAESDSVTEHLGAIEARLEALGFSPALARTALETCDAFATGFLLVRARPTLPRQGADPREDLAASAFDGYTQGVRVICTGLRAVRSTLT